MTETERASIERLIAEYREALTGAADARHEAATLEIRRAEWVNAEMDMLIVGGMNKTDANRRAHADTIHRSRQHEIAAAQLKADFADRDARVLAFCTQLALALAALQHPHNHPHKEIPHGQHGT